MAESLGDAILHLRTDDSGLDAGIAAGKAKALSVAATFDQVGDRAIAVGQKLSLGLTLPIAAFAAQAIPAAIESRQALAQVDATLASMGPVAGRTSEELQKAAAALEDMSLADDDDILKSVTANMLTFGNVSGPVFDRAQQAAVNLSARLGSDLQSAALQVGKALNDPIKGMAALQKVGVSLSAAQKEQVKAMVAVGDTAGAQGIILSELERQFGGAAKAQRDATPGAEVHQGWRKLQETVGEIALNALPPLIAVMSRVLDGFNSLDPGMQSAAVGALAVAAAAGPLAMMFGGVAKGVGFVLPLFTRLGPVFTTLASGIARVVPVISVLGRALLTLAMNPVFLAIAAAIGAVYLAWSNWDKIKPVIDAVGAAVSNWWSATVAPILKSVGDGVQALVAIFQDYFGTQLTTVINTVKALFNGDFKAVFRGLGAIMSAPFEAAWKLIQAFAPNVAASMRGLYQGVKFWVQDRLNSVWTWVTGKIEAVKKSFFDLYDAVVGHSYVPDMVDGIRDEFARLDGVMVAVAQAATGKTGDAFAQLRDRVQSLLDALFPQQAEIAKLEAQYKLLDEALANKLITPSVYAEARDRLRKELEKLRAEAEAMVGGDKPLVDESSFIDPTKLDVKTKTKGGTAPDDETAAKWREGFSRWFAGGVRAALDGDLWGFLKDWFFNVLDKAFSSALEEVGAALGDILGQILGGFGGGGGGGLGKVFAGFFARGGTIPPGQFGIAGENGPEPVFSTPGGALIRPTSAMGSLRAPAGGNSFTFNMPVDATGADPAAIERLRSEMARFRAELPSQIVQTVQDAGDRRLLRSGGWQ